MRQKKQKKERETEFLFILTSLDQPSSFAVSTDQADGTVDIRWYNKYIWNKSYYLTNLCVLHVCYHHLIYYIVIILIICYYYFNISAEKSFILRVVNWLAHDLTSFLSLAPVKPGFDLRLGWVLSQLIAHLCLPTHLPLRCWSLKEVILCHQL